MAPSLEPRLRNSYISQLRKSSNGQVYSTFSECVTVAGVSRSVMHLSELLWKKVLAAAKEGTRSLCRRTEDTPFFEPVFPTQNRKGPVPTFPYIPVTAFRHY